MVVLKNISCTICWVSIIWRPFPCSLLLFRICEYTVRVATGVDITTIVRKKKKQQWGQYFLPTSYHFCLSNEAQANTQSAWARIGEIIIIPTRMAFVDSRNTFILFMRRGMSPCLVEADNPPSPSLPPPPPLPVNSNNSDSISTNQVFSFVTITDVEFIIFFLQLRFSELSRNTRFLYNIFLLLKEHIYIYILCTYHQPGIQVSVLFPNLLYFTVLDAFGILYLSV